VKWGLYFLDILTSRYCCCIKAYYLIPFLRFLTFCIFFPQDYATTYHATRDAYLKADNELKIGTGPYKLQVQGPRLTRLRRWTPVQRTEKIER
jgi:hypothetical protein